MGLVRLGVCLWIVLSLLAIRCVATVMVIGKNISLTFDDVEANFSPIIKSPGVSGTLFVAEPLDACSQLTNVVEEDSSSFVLVQRGVCTFDEKVMAAQTAGFKAVIVYDNVDSMPLVAMAGNPIGISAYAVFVSKASGEALKEYAGRADVDVWIIPTFESSAWSVMAITFISLLAMSAVLATCFFVRRHRVRRDRPRGANPGEPQGMSKQLVKAMPSVIFSAPLEDNCTSQACAICLEDYNIGELIRILPCRHKFHAECVDSWLTTWRTFCPVCKRDAQSSPPAGPLPCESTPLLAPSPSPSFPRPIPSSLSQSIRIPPSLSPSPSPSLSLSSSRLVSHRRRHLLYNSPSAMPRPSSHRSLASLLAASRHSAASLSARGSSIGSPSYLAGSLPDC